MNNGIKFFMFVCLILTTKSEGQKLSDCVCEIINEEVLVNSPIRGDTVYPKNNYKQIQNRIISIEKNQLLIGYENLELGNLKCEYEIINSELFLDIGSIGEFENNEYRVIKIAENGKYQELLITFPGKIHISENIILNGKKVQHLDSKYKSFLETFEIVKNDTINKTDKFGLKQGIWIENDSSQIFGNKKESKYLNNVLLTENETSFYLNGNIKQIEFYNAYPSQKDSIYQIQYYRSGNILETKYNLKFIKEGDSFRQIYYENGNIIQDFIYMGSHIKLIGYYENGQKEYEGESLVGIEVFNNGPRIEYNSWKSKIDCKYWLEEGGYVGIKELEFLTLGLMNLKERIRRRTKHRRQ